MKTRNWMMAMASVVMLPCGVTLADDLRIQSFNSTGRLTFSTLNDGTNHNYQVEWAPSVAGPWTPFTGVGAWLDNISSVAGSIVTSTVPMCYRVVATLGDYLVVDISGGTNAAEYPVSYYRTLADIPGGVGVNIDAYKTTNMVFRRIPAGTFMMGSPTNELGRNDNIDPETQHQVTLTKPFYIGVFEVTQKQWALVMGTWPSFFTNASYRDSRPVEQVSYYDIRENPANSDDPMVDWPANSAVNADSFMGKLRAKTGLVTFDLPTESQWEYAGRAGTTTALNSGKNLTDTNSCPNMAEVGRYWYNGPQQFGNTASVDTSGGTAKVGTYLPNAWGLYDIHGNAWEWCLDWYGTYPGASANVNPGGPASGLGRVGRYGSNDNFASDCRSASRYFNDPSDRQDHDGLGFRVAMSLP